MQLSVRKFLGALALVALFAGAGQAAVFDWTGRTFSGNSTTYTNVDGSGYDIVVSLSGNTNRNISGYPTVSSAFEIDRALDLYYDFNSRTEGLTVTVSFYYSGTSVAAPVTDISFSVFDLDTGNTSNPTTYRDQVRNVRGTALDNSTFGANLSSNGTHSITNNGTITATATAVASSGTLDDDNSAGTVDVSFGSVNQGWSYQFTYGNPNNSTVNSNPSSQAIGFGDITFTVVPEASTWAMGLLLIGLAVWTTRQRRRQAVGP